jgi:hypothetical protein
VGRVEEVPAFCQHGEVFWILRFSDDAKKRITDEVGRHNGPSGQGGEKGFPSLPPTLGATTDTE